LDDLEGHAVLSLAPCDLKVQFPRTAPRSRD
jgi:hypothetical protein